VKAMQEIDPAPIYGKVKACKVTGSRIGPVSTQYT